MGQPNNKLRRFTHTSIKQYTHFQALIQLQHKIHVLGSKISTNMLIEIQSNVLEMQVAGQVM